MTTDWLGLAEVLAELGFGDAEIRSLAEAKIISTSPAP